MEVKQYPRIPRVPTTVVIVALLAGTAIFIVTMLGSLPSFNSTSSSIRRSVDSASSTLRVIHYFADGNTTTDPSKPVLGRTIALYPPTETWPPQPTTLKASFDERPCIPLATWQTTSHPNCNTFHEVEMASNDIQMLGKGRGSHRNAWVHRWEDETLVLKTLKWKRNDFDAAKYEKHRVDALAMERLTSSPRVVDIYGYCGTSTYNQFAATTLQGLVYMPVSMTRTERLALGTELARCVADVHSIDGEGNVTISHNDIKPDNFVLVNGTVKLNDFDRAVLMKWNQTGHRPCYYGGRIINPNSTVAERFAPFKPREQILSSFPMTEMMDLYALGGMLYLTLTGEVPFAIEFPSKKKLERTILKGELPELPSKYKRSEDSRVRALVQEIKRCLDPHPEDRPTAREAADNLATALRLHLASSNQTDEGMRFEFVLKNTKQQVFLKLLKSECLKGSFS